MFYLLVIWARYIIRLIFDYFLWLFGAIYGLTQYIARFFITFFSEGWITFFIVAIGSFVLLTVVGAYQTPTMQAFDAIYSCFIIPVAEFLMSLLSSTTVLAWDELAPRWNDAVLAGRDCFNAFVNGFFGAIDLDNVGFYTDVLRFAFDFFECIIRIPFETPSWILPFGITDTIFSFIQINICYYEFLLFFFTGVVDLTIVRNDPVFCTYDPDATCFVRTVPSLLDPSRYPPTLEGLENCQFGVAIDCQIITCTLRTISNFTAIIEATTGADVSGLIEELIEPTCCFITSFYKAPVFLGLGLIGSDDFPPCFDVVLSPDFIVDNMLIPMRDCFIDILFIVSQGTIDDIFNLIFAIFFDFIQIIIDSYNFLLLCIEREGPCFITYPDNCVVDNDTGFAFAGLQTCIGSLGQCILNGVGDIPPNPVITGPVWEAIIEDGFFEIARFIDTLVCNLVPFQRCSFGPDFPGTPTLGNGGSCPTPTADPFTWILSPACFFNCLTVRVPLLAPVANLFSVAFSAINSILINLTVIVELLYDFIDDVCSTLNGVPGVSCSIPPFPGMKEERNAKFDNLLQLLEHYEINFEGEQNFCSSVLLEYATTDDVEKLDDNRANYLSYRGCLALLSLGMKSQNDFPDKIKAKNMIDFSTMFSEYSKIWNLWDQKRGERDPFTRLRTNATALGEYRAELFERETSDRLNATRRYNNPESFLLRYHEKDSSKAIALRNSAIAAEPGSTAVKISRAVMAKVTTHAMEMEGFQLTTGFIGFVQKINKIYYSIDYRRNNALMLLDQTSHAVQAGNASEIVDAIVSRDDPYYQHMLQTAADWMPPYPTATTVWESETNDLHRRKFIEQQTLDIFSHTYNRARVFIGDGGWRQDLKKELRAAGYAILNNRVLNVDKRVYDLTVDEVSEMLSEDRATVLKNSKKHIRPKKTFTAAELNLEQGRIEKEKSKLKRFWKSVKKVGSHISETSLFNLFFKNDMFRASPVVQTSHMFYSQDEKTILSGKFVDNVTKYFSERTFYDLDKGFISKEEHDEIVANRDNSTFHVWDMFTGDYNVRRPRRHGFMFSDPDKTYFNFKGMKDLFYQNVKEMKLKQLRRIKGDEEITEEELKKFRLENISNRIDNWVIDFLNYIVNAFFGAISQLFFQIDFTVRFDLLLLDWIDRFDPEDIALDAADAVLDYFNSLIECNIPEDFDGTNEYKFGCFPFVDEALLRGWSNPIGSGNTYFPLQSGINPIELIITPCVNVFNGESNVFKYRRSDNCDSMDGLPRPLCPVCDYCQAEYRSCFDVKRDGIVNSIFFILGMIGPILQFFFRGTVSLSTITRFYYFVVIWVLGAGGFTAFFTPYITVPSVIIASALSRFIGVSFSQFEGFGQDDLPVGGVYIVTLVAAQYFASNFLSTIPGIITTFVLYGGAIAWAVNLIFPFNGIRETLRFSQWGGLVFEFLDLAPQPLKPVPWTSSVEASVIYDYSTKGIPYLDVFCFFWTLDNLFIIGAGVFALIYAIQFLFYVAWPSLLFLIALIGNTLQLLANLRFWRVKEDTYDNTKMISEMDEKLTKLTSRVNNSARTLSKVGIEIDDHHYDGAYRPQYLTDKKIAEYIGVKIQ